MPVNHQSINSEKLNGAEQMDGFVMRVHYQFLEAEGHQKYPFMDRIWTPCSEKLIFQRYPWEKGDPDHKSWKGIFACLHQEERVTATNLNKKGSLCQGESRVMSWSGNYI